MKRIQKGFTLIELMIVVAIIGILAAVAIPAYQDYIVKAKLSKVQSTLDPLKLALAAYYQTNGSFPIVTGTASTVASPGGQPDTTVDVWTSIGLSSTPTLPNEVANIAYITDSAGASFNLTMVMTNIKANSINNLSISITPSTGVAVGSAPASSNSFTGTAMSWHYACTASIDPIAQKYFNNNGANCTSST